MKGRAPASILAVTILLMCACGATDDPGPDAGSDVPVIITQPDYGKDPGGTAQDPGGPTDPGVRPDFGPGYDPGPLPDDPGPTVDDPGPTPEDPGPVEDPGGPCVPNCAGKQCGTNGCGGSCGNCTGNAQCIGQQCVCIPECSSKECGDDGCGGQCGTGCNGQPCMGNGKCAALSCMVSKIMSTNRSCVNNPTGSSSGGEWWMNDGAMQLASYSSACTSEIWGGAEVVYRFVPDGTGPVTFTFTGAANLRFFVLEDKGGQVCLGSTCIASTTSTMDVSVTKGRTYYLVVDGNEYPKQGSYEFSLSCPWTPVTADK